MPSDLASLAQSTQETEPFKIVLRDEVSSTNDIVRQMGEAFLVVVADGQSSGRGRLQRGWFSPKGLNIYMTVALPLPEGFPSLGLLPATAGLSVLQALRQSIPDRAEALALKWPNDVYLQMKKVSGVLIEKVKKGIYAVGIGINVNMTEEDISPELRQKACSLKSITGRHFRRDEIIKGVLKGLIHYREVLLEEPVQIVEEFNRRALTTWREVTITDQRGTYRALALGMALDGTLRVRDHEGRLFRISSADVEVCLR